MKKEHKILAAVFGGFAVLSVLAIAAFIGLIISIGSGQPEEGSFSHEVEYSADFTANGTLNDTVFYLPYPENKEFRETVRMNRSNVSFHNEWNANLSIVNTSRGEMLKAEIGDFKPQRFDERFQEEINQTKLPDEVEREEILNKTDTNGTELSDYATYDLVISVDYNRSLDTRNGLTEEPHLRSNTTTLTECGDSIRQNCNVTTTEAYLEYDTGNETYMEMSVRLDGRNSWWNWGWSGNSYRQSFYNSYYDDRKIVGSQNSWITLTGSEEEGEGNYRN